LPDLEGNGGGQIQGVRTVGSETPAKFDMKEESFANTIRVFGVY
jgi:hypothetical protein